MDRGRRLDVAWESVAPTLSSRDRGWVQEAVFGTLRLRGRIDHLLNLHLDRGLESVPLPLLRLLRLGAYQILYMRSVPAYAAVSQTATQASDVGGAKATGLVNAVLRSLDRAGGGVERFPALSDDPVGHLSTWGSHPRWLVERWIRYFGANKARTIIEAGNRLPSLFFRPVGQTVAEAAKALEAVAVESFPGPEGSRTLRLAAGTDPAAVLSLVSGIIQDPAAARTAEFVGVGPGERVADLCTAPGGKGIALADLGGWVVGLDPSFGRLGRMAGALQRLGLPKRLVVARGESPPLRRVDVALVDAPCTGTGTLARHPDARWRLTPDVVTRMAALQSMILEGAATIVRPGGRLVYATCTLEPEENERVVESFLEAHPEFVLDREREFLRVLPGEEGTDGAFAARVLRVE